MIQLVCDAPCAQLLETCAPPGPKRLLAASLPAQDLYRPLKMNVAAIGNIVSQLHVHVTGRMQSDPSWPGPCYGEQPGQGGGELLAALLLVAYAWTSQPLMLPQCSRQRWSCLLCRRAPSAHCSPAAARHCRRRRAGRAAGTRAAAGGAGHAEGRICTCQAVTGVEGCGSRPGGRA